MSLQVIYNIRYQTPSIYQRSEASMMKAVGDITNEDPGTPDHENRHAWAQWANTNSSAAVVYFLWPISMNPSIQTSVASDPTGNSVPDGDIDFVVISALDKVIADCIANPPIGFNPPTP